MTGPFDVAHGDRPPGCDEDTGRIGVLDIPDIQDLEDVEDVSGDPGEGHHEHHERGHVPAEEPRTSGHRHRPGPGRWTPSARGGIASHARTEPIPPVDAQPETHYAQPDAQPDDQPDDQPEGRVDDYPDATGDLALAEEIEPGSRLTRRRRVLLTPPTEADAHDDEDTRVYPASPRGLGTFDLGSVPASVTPPRTWRKAAWFASIASGAAVAAMLMAGTAFVDDSTEDSRALQTWPEPHSPQPTLPGNDGNGTPRTGENGEPTRPGEPTTSEGAEDGSDVPASHRTTSSTDSGALTGDGGEGGDVGDDTGADGSADPGHGDTSGTDGVATPPKPPVTPAPTERVPVVLWAKHDSDVLAQRSQQYFNTVTENPDAAHKLTTGELAALGPAGLAQRYADVAYFEVREVYVDSREGYTLNTVTVTYVDGTTAEQTRKLVFSDDDLIAADHG